MSPKFRWLAWLCGIVLIGNFFALRIYGEALSSTHLFIVRGTVFYPLAWLNLAAGVLLILVQIRELMGPQNKKG